MADKGTHWAEIEDFGIVWGMKFLVLVHRYLGRWLLPIFLYPTVAYYFVANRLARDASMDYLTRLARNAPDTDLAPTRWTSFRHFLSFAHSMLDRVSAWSGVITHDSIEFPNREAVERYVLGGRGVMMITAHLGCLEVCRALASQRDDIKLNLLVHTKNAQRINQLLEPLNLQHQLELIEVTEVNPGTAIVLAEKIERGEVVVVVGDRVPVNSDKNTVAVDFLGAPARFAQGPWVLAHVLKCRVMTLFCIRHKGRYHMYVEPLAEQVKLPRRTRDEAVTGYVAQYVDRLEKYCRLAPLQWFNFYPYWITTTDAEKAT